ncbi:hypothetical protein G6L37_04770 [Agrobacterium rubi]|nr:hypothetical protein [Agrobacterium rubi]NTF24667.1 hypothetical protein [Agrobacterium rubi]
MSSSLARMERRAARSRDEKKLGGLLQSSLSRAVLSMAQDHSAGKSRKLDVSDLLSQDGFDHALIAATPRILDTSAPSSLIGFHQSVSPGSKFDMPSFVRRLTDEAGHMEFDGVLADGTKATIRADLFALPVIGWMHAVANFVPVPDNILALARSFRECGIAGKGSSIVLSPTLLDVDTVSDMLPGTVRLLTQILQLPLSDPDFAVSDAVMAALGMAEIEDGFGQQDFLCHRLMTGVRIQVVRSGEKFEDDIFSGRSDETHGLALWKSRITQLLPSGIQMLQPQSFSRARSSLALEIVTGHLILEAHDSGLPMSDVFDEVHMNEKNGHVVVDAVLSDQPLGPVSVPSLAAFSDAEWFTEQIVRLSRSTIGGETKPQGKELLQ